MATKIVTKNSSTASAVPTASDLVQGELAVNVADKRLFTEDNAGAIVELGTNPTTLNVNGTATMDGLNIDTTTPFMSFKESGATKLFIGESSAVGGGAGYYDFYAVTGLGQRFFTNSLERMRIDSSGNVGIGVVPEAWTYFSPIQAKRSSFAGSDGQTGVGYNWYFDGAYKYIANDYALAYQQNATSGVHSWSTAASGTADASISWSERMRIDSSGNLLVGTTDTAPGVADTNVGVALNSGRVFASAEADYALNLNRNTSDGDIVRFRKDGTAVGSIGTGYGVVDIKGGSAGLLMGNTAVLPVNGSGTLTTDSYDIGAGSFRFKDLYLSGGVYLGGTGAANKLDDYEEGTWTPAFVGFSGVGGWGFVNAKYTKIGNLVYLSCDISGGSGTLSSTQNSSRLSGMPFIVNGTNSPCSFATNYITDEGTGVLYGNVLYTPTFSITNEKVIYFSGVYQTA